MTNQHTDEMREAFEKWCELNLEKEYRKNSTNDYRWNATQCQWEGWQAATAAAEAKYLPVIEKLVGAATYLLENHCGYRHMDAEDIETEISLGNEDIKAIKNMREALAEAKLKIGEKK